MAKEPDERYQSAKDLAVDLRALSRDLSTTAGTSTATPGSPVRRHFGAVTIALALLVVVIGTVAIIVWRRGGPVPAAPQTAFQRLTATGSLEYVTISPDGRFIAYSQYQKGGTGLWLRQLASGEDLQLVPAAPGEFLGAAFMPDGNAIVYAVSSAQDLLGALYRVSTIGGPPQRLLSGVASAPTFAPDGKRMAWLRAQFPAPEESALMIANSDGSEPRAVAVRRRPEEFAPIYFGRPAWSPDGKLIAAVVRRLRDPNSADLIGFEPDSGREISLSSAPWVSLSSLAWMPDNSGIVAIGAADQASIHGVTHTGNQIWFIPHPQEAPRRITNDLLYYREVSLSADGTKLVADVADASVYLWRSSLHGDDAPQRISSGHFDGVGGVSAMADGRLVFTSTERGTTTLWSMDRDGGRRRQVIRKPYREEYPVAFAGGIAYVSSTPTATELCVTNNEGEGRRVVVSGIDEGPVAVSPDGRWFAYTVNDRLWSFSANGTRKQLTEGRATAPAFSPSGDRIAFITGKLDMAGNPESGTAGSAELIVLRTGDWKPVWSAPVKRWTVNWLRWSSDGDAILVGSWSDIWRYPLRGQPERLAGFGDLIWSFEPAGDDLFVARGTVTRDAVLITGFR
ncbi:MAG: hypothetical protein ABI718_12215 [Acidobacteriota bacterium]